jgi:methyl-accepting chemotaxis protein
MVVAIASQQQASGIGQMTKAIAEMQEVTQRNAASADESASTSEELNAQSKSLFTIVGDLSAMAGARGFDSTISG